MPTTIILPGGPPIVDYGNAPVTYVGGLARVDVLGEQANFALWGWRVTMLDGRTTKTREVVHNLVLPCDAVGPGIELTLDTFGPRLILPAARFFVNRWLA